MPDFAFDGPGLRAIEPAGAGLLAEFDFVRDLYSAWKRWAVLNDGENLKFGELYTAEGGTPIGTTGRSTGVSFVQDAALFIRPDERHHVLALVGPSGVDANLFSGGGRLSTLTLGNFSTEVTVTNAASAQLLETGVSGMTAQESAAFLQNTADLSQVAVDINEINNDIAMIDGDIATIQTDTGQIQIDVSAMQGDLAYVHQMERGRWEIDTTPGATFGHMIFYNEGGTPIRTFALQNAAGDPVIVNPAKRVIVS